MGLERWWSDSDRGKCSARRRGRQCTLYNVTLKGVRETIVAVEKRYYMQGAFTIHLLSVTCLAVPYFPRLLLDAIFFWGGVLNMKCVCSFSLQLSSETFLILRRIHRDIITNVHRSSCKVPVILVRF